jgi:nucleotide-binding universal stress UspA family protein
VDCPCTSAVAEIATAFRKYGEQSITEAEILAKHAKERIKRILPNWDVCSISTYGSPAREILDIAEKLKPDLIVVGSDGRSAFSKFLLGSISQKVLTEAVCSVRIARGKIEVDDQPVCLVVGFDGSKGAFAAVRAVAARAWGSGTEVHLVIATEPTVPSSIGRFVSPISRPVDGVDVYDKKLFEELGNNALEILNGAGLKSTLQIRPGGPKQVLAEVAERLGAHCIFVGASSDPDDPDRILPGSTSTAVAARAHCSVEVVREKPSKQFVSQTANKDRLKVADTADG